MQQHNSYRTDRVHATARYDTTRHVQTTREEPFVKRQVADARQKTGSNRTRPQTFEQKKLRVIQHARLEVFPPPSPRQFNTPRPPTHHITSQHVASTLTRVEVVAKTQDDARWRVTGCVGVHCASHGPQVGTHRAEVPDCEERERVRRRRQIPASEERCGGSIAGDTSGGRHGGLPTLRFRCPASSSTWRHFRCSSSCTRSPAAPHTRAGFPTCATSITFPQPCRPDSCVVLFLRWVSRGFSWRLAH